MYIHRVMWIVLLTYINHDSIPRGFEAEVFAGQMPFLLPTHCRQSTECIETVILHDLGLHRKSLSRSYTVNYVTFVWMKFSWISRVGWNNEIQYPWKFSLPIKRLVNTGKNARLKCSKISTLQNCQNWFTVFGNFMTWYGTMWPDTH